MEIYAVKISDINEENLKELCLLIDSEKKCKIEKFVNKKDKIRSIISEILIRTIIIKKLKISNKHIKFSKNQYGKPYLNEYSNFNFNISHSGDYILCAIDNNIIGIDVEKIKNIEYKEIAKSFFTKKEFEYIVNQDLNVQLNKFYDIWILKESYIKCCGQGLSMKLESFSIEIDEFKNIKLLSNNKCKDYIFKLFNIDLDYKVAVCSINKEIPNNIIKIEQKFLINRFIEFNFE